MNTLQLAQYYAGLLIMQYIGMPKAYAMTQVLATPAIMPQSTVETVAFSLVAASGAFVLNYNGVDSASINWNDSAATIQTKLRAIGGPCAAITVTGSIASELLTINFNFTVITTPAFLFTVTSNSLEDGSGDDISLTISETDLVLPLAVQDAYNLTGPNIAQGKQLEILGKYVGVTNTGFGLTGLPITLDDTDFLTLIQFAIIRNSAGSSLNTISNLIYQFFGTNVLVFDYQNMNMSFLVSSAIGSYDLFQLVVTEGLLPVPMAVGATIVYYPIITEFFGFRTYQAPNTFAEPFNNYIDYVSTWPWLSYSEVIVY